MSKAIGAGDPMGGSVKNRWRAFSSRHLLYELVIKDIRVRYRRPILGFVWAFLTPLAMTGILYLVFGRFLKIKIEEAPFLLYLTSALFTWRLFQDSLSAATTSLYDNRALLRESRSPFYLFPLSIILVNTFVALPGYVLVIVLSAVQLHGLSWHVLLLPFVLAVHAAMTAACSVIAALLYVRWRDIRYLIETSLVFLFYATPVFYSVNLVHELLPAYAYRIYVYNPFTCILTLYRVAFIKGYAVHVQDPAIVPCIIIAVVTAALLWASAVLLYRVNKKYVIEHVAY
ncbi:MAG TPA: ABC transporter permease [Candidatus Omnitrophota bacterium]|nr:ABC transporter permease [Candidatus Omnitrophota bacterium]